MRRPVSPARYLGDGGTGPRRHFSRVAPTLAIWEEPLTRHFCVTLALAALSVVLCRADSIDDFVKQQIRKRNICGLSLAVIENGRIVKAKGYGFSDRATRRPVTVDTLFQAGSISKAVAAVGALRLVERGKLSLDDDVNRWLVSWKLPDNPQLKRERVTLRLILSHTAGVTVHGFPGYAVNAKRPTLLQILDGVNPSNTPAIRVDIMPGSQWRYSGGGYTIMQQMMVDATGKPFPDWMRENVLEPLGMRQSTFEQPLPADRAGRAASGYWPEAKPVAGRWHVYPEMAAAGLWTTPSDLARFAIGVQRAYTGAAGSILSRETARKMLSYEREDDGLGLFLQSSGRTLRFVHDGRDAGFDALLSAYAETGQGAVIMINANDDSQMMVRVLEKIAAQYHWPDFPIQPVYRAIPDAEPRLAARVMTLFKDLSKGVVDKDLMAPPLADLISLRMKSGLARFLRDVGPLQGIELVERKTEGTDRHCRYRLRFKRQDWLAPCTFDRNDRLTSVALEPE